MEKMMDFLVHHPVIFLIAVLFSVMILFSFLRTVVRTALVVAALLVLYAAYLWLTGGHIPEAFHSLEQWVVHLFQQIISFFTSLFKLPKKGLG